MEYGLLVTAVIGALIAGAVCYGLKVRKTYAVLLAQFVTSFALTTIIAMTLASRKESPEYGKVALICAGICLLLFGIETLLKKTIGPLENRKPG